MSDAELLERLRDLGIRSANIAADRIEALTAERDALTAQINRYRESHMAMLIKNERLLDSITGIKRAAALNMQNDPKDAHSYYFHTADAALDNGKEPSHE